jgi:hypothetical protein
MSVTGKRGIPSTTTTMILISSDSKSENAANKNHRQAKPEYRRIAGRKIFVTLQRVLSHDVRSILMMSVVEVLSSSFQHGDKLPLKIVHEW